MITKRNCKECGAEFVCESGHYFDNTTGKHKHTCSKAEPRGGFIL